MNTKDTILSYFEALKQKKDWQPFLSDDMTFISNGSAPKQGKDEYTASTKRFFSMIQSVEVKELLIEGEKACALTHYELQSQNGNTFVSDVAEIYTVREGKIISFVIYFDTAPFTSQK